VEAPSPGAKGDLRKKLSRELRKKGGGGDLFTEGGRDIGKKGTLSSGQGKFGNEKSRGGGASPES